MVDRELFGSPDMRRGASLWTLLRDDPRYTYYGRMVSLANAEVDALERVSALTRAQGISNWQYLPADDAGRCCATPLGMGPLGLHRP